MFDLKGRVALVTGGGRNAGAGIARALSQAGASVAVNDVVASRAHQVAGEIREAGGTACAAPFDVTDRGAVENGVERAREALGDIDILVNNAGVPEAMQLEPFREMDPDRYADYVDLNLYGVMHCTRSVLGGMCDRGFGRIITISSGAGQIGIGIGVAAYGASKAGALGFMRHVAIEFAQSGVTANSLALGMMASAAPGEAGEQMARGVPVGRLGTPADVGAAVVFLASEEASWVTGQTIGLNGGAVTS